jgi:pimeloyl-ACP methyl ester carboxylesterase
MKNITTTLLAGIVGVAIVLSGCKPPQSQQPPVKNIVLVHGAFADGTSWAKVIPILEARGFHVVAVQNPLTSLSDDVNATRRIIAMQDGPVILVGHSWGGAVISEVGDDPKVAGLVYVAAYVPDVGMSANETSEPFGATPGQKAIQIDSQHFAWMSEEGILNSFAEGLPMDERRLVLAVQTGRLSMAWPPLKGFLSRYRPHAACGRFEFNTSIWGRCGSPRSSQETWTRGVGCVHTKGVTYAKKGHDYSTKSLARKRSPAVVRHPASTQAVTFLHCIVPHPVRHLLS